jgi:hypothetical protein
LNNQGFIDLDELVLLCRNDNAKSFISEAISCYKVGAYRQCIVATWIAVVYDIIHKLQELDLTGDKKARRKLEAYEQILQDGDIRKALIFENSILDLAKDEFELLSVLEHSDLARIKEDRNRCAHPALNRIDEVYQPSAELARTHIRNGVLHLLQHPPVQGKAALGKIINEYRSDFFPTNVDNAKVYFQQGPLSRPRDSLVKNFTIVLIKEFLNEELNSKKEKQCLAALIALREMHRELVENTFRERLNDIMFSVDDNFILHCIKFLFGITDTWQYLAENTRQKLQIYIEEMPHEDLFPGILMSKTIPDLEENSRARLEQLTTEQVAHYLEFNLDDEEIKNLAIERYLQSPSFGTANSLARELILPFLHSFTKVTPLQKGYRTLLRTGNL